MLSVLLARLELTTQNSTLGNLALWWNGRHGRLKICSALRGWGFKSLQGHQ